MPVLSENQNQRTLKDLLGSTQGTVQASSKRPDPTVLVLGPLPRERIFCEEFEGSEIDCIQTANKIWALYNHQIVTGDEAAEFTPYSQVIFPDGTSCFGLCIYSKALGLFGSPIESLIVTNVEVDMSKVIFRPIDHKKVVTLANLTYTINDLSRNGMSRVIKIMVHDTLVKNNQLPNRWQISVEFISFTTPLGAPYSPGAGQYFGWSGL